MRFDEVCEHYPIQLVTKNSSIIFLSIYASMVQWLQQQQHESRDHESRILQGKIKYKRQAGQDLFL